MSARITEAEMADVVRTILNRRPNKSATFAELREIIPEHVHLSRADRTKSPSRPGEELWEQIIRNLVSHKHDGFVGVRGGIRLQWKRGGVASERLHVAA
jgi:hypothetical protein